MIQVDPISVPSPGNLPPNDPAEFDFERSSRRSASEMPVPLGGVPRALRESAESSGIDPLAELYNESLRYAQEGHLRLARERLQMLLCMAPDDGEARLMLARVHVAGQRWPEALLALDEAASCGVSVPMSLRRAVEDHLNAEQASKDEQRGAVRAREQGEVKALRSEARRLRSEAAQLPGRVTELEREVRKWAWATATVSGIAILFVAGSLLMGASSGGGGEVADAGDEVSVVEASAGAEATATAAAAAAPSAPRGPAGITVRAAAALDAAPGLEGTEFQLRLVDGALVVKGEVPTFKHRKTVERVLHGVEGAGRVDVDAIEILSRTRGAVYEVQSGDTLSHIAYAHYGVSTLTKPIEQANGVDARTLRIGQELRVPAVE